MDSKHTPLLALLLGGAVSCADDALDPDANATLATGFTTGSSDAASTTGADTGDTGPAPTGEGDIRGIVTFTRYAKGMGEDDLVGLAGAWRDTLAFEEIDDFFAVHTLHTTFPPPPEGPGELRHDAVPTPFDWGAPEDWLVAGNGIELVADDVGAIACLLMVADAYPVYVASHSPLQPEACRPDPASWQPETTYDLVLYGGSLFETNVLTEQVFTPPAFELLAPDPDAPPVRVGPGEPLEVAWTSGGDAHGRLVIRMFDGFGRMFTINANDDGSSTIPAAAMDELASGPATLIVAREWIDVVPFSDGTLKVVTRYEHRAIVELD